MKISKYSIAAAFGAVMMALAGCAEEEIKESRAILPADDEIVLPAAACEKTFTVYADGTWLVDVTEEWLSVTPNSGEGTMDVLIEAEENTGDEAREAKLIIKGASTISDVEVVVKQKMDRFRTMSPITVTEAVALKEGDLAKIGGAQVMATTKKGFVISDGTSNIFVSGTASVKVGDLLTITGDVAKVNDLIGIVLDEATVSGNEDVVYPEAKDVTTAESYAPGKVELVKALASCAGGNLTINGKKSAAIYNPVQDINGINKHDIEITGYYIGVSSKLAAIALVSYVDNGATPIIGKALPFKDNFDWVAPFVQYDKDNGRTTGDSMGSKATVNYGNAYAIPGFEDMFTGEMGYESMFYSSKTVYVCGGNYLKFSKTNNCNGVRLPAFAIDGATDLRLSFDWGKNVGDDVELEVQIEGDGTIDGAAKSGVLTPDGDFTWKNETIVINGATAGTRICIRPTTYTGAVATDGKLYRWFLDNVEVVSLAGMKEANIEVAGTENGVITFEGLEPTDVNLTITSDSDFSVNTTASWLHLDVTEGLAGEPTAVVVSCDPSDLSTMRKDEITIKSGLSEKKIMVIQSAAGQLLDPLISVICSKSTDGLLGEGDEFSVSVQANVEYEVAISDEWIKEIEVPATRASVEKSEHSFSLDVNITGAARTGYIRFFNEASNVEAVVIVKQENFVPRIDVTLPRQLGYIPVEGKTFTAQISSNIAFTVSSDAVTLPVTSAEAGEYEVPVTVNANSGAARDVEVVFQNDTYSFSKTVSLTQLGSNVLFADNFDWLAPLEEVYSAANSGKVFGQSVEDNDTGANAPNAYTVAGLKDGVFTGAFADKGYVDLNPSAKVIYPQHYYLKMGKTGYTTGLVIPEINLSATSNVEVQFNWACHRRVVSGVDETDPVDIVVEVRGTDDSVVYTSETLKTTQPLGKMEWQSAKVSLPSVAPGQRIAIHPLDMKPGSKVVPRWYIDNIVVVSK
ncbi:MAG: BACON domain-containing protein [Candidatus Cryptobacteroides sp.]